MALIETEASAAPEDTILQLRRAYLRSPEGASARGPLSFMLVAGLIHVLFGDEGSGKSTILEAIALARAPTRGGMALFGEDVATMSNRDRSRARRRIGMIYQDLRLADELDAYGNIALAVRAAGGDQIARGPDIEETLAWLGLAKSEGRPAGDLPAKARRRLALARAVINRPDLLIADEPFGEGDDGILGLLRDVNRGGTAVLLATADLSVAARVGGVRLEWPGASTPPSRRDDPDTAP